jgi:hypothetical protein
MARDKRSTPTRSTPRRLIQGLEVILIIKTFKPSYLALTVVFSTLTHVY